MNVLHLIAAPATDAPPWRVTPRECPGEESALAACAGVLAARPDHRAVLLGGSGAEVLAHATGLRAAWRLAPALGDWRLAAPALRRLLRDRRPRAIVAWGAPLGTLARHASLEAPTFDIDLNAGLIREHGRGEGEALPVAPGRPAAPAHPAVTGAPARATNGARRLLLVGSRGAPLTRLAYAACIVGVAGQACEIIAPAWARGRRRAERIVREGGYIRSLRVTASMRDGLDMGCDVAVCPSERPTYADLLALAQALARGAAVVAADTPGTRALLAGPASIGLAESSDKASLARAIMRVLRAPLPGAGAGSDTDAGARGSADADALALAIDAATSREPLECTA